MPNIQVQNDSDLDPHRAIWFLELHIYQQVYQSSKFDVYA